MALPANPTILIHESRRGWLTLLSPWDWQDWFDSCPQSGNTSVTSQLTPVGLECWHGEVGSSTASFAWVDSNARERHFRRLVARVDGPQRSGPILFRCRKWPAIEGKRGCARKHSLRVLSGLSGPLVR